MGPGFESQSCQYFSQSKESRSNSSCSRFHSIRHARGHVTGIQVHVVSETKIKIEKKYYELYQLKNYIFTLTSYFVISNQTEGVCL